MGAGTRRRCRGSWSTRLGADPELHLPHREGVEVRAHLAGAVLALEGVEHVLGAERDALVDEADEHDLAGSEGAGGCGVRNGSLGVQVAVGEAVSEGGAALGHGVVLSSSWAIRSTSASMRSWSIGSMAPK